MHYYGQLVTLDNVNTQYSNIQHTHLHMLTLYNISWMMLHNLRDIWFNFLILLCLRSTQNAYQTRVKHVYVGRAISEYFVCTFQSQAHVNAIHSLALVLQSQNRLYKLTFFSVYIMRTFKIYKITSGKVYLIIRDWTNVGK